jgi:hypothetical protein
MNDLDQFFGRHGLGSMTTQLGVDHMFADMILNHFGDESVQGPAAGGGLLQYTRTLVIRIDRSLNRFDLAAQALQAV